MSFFSRAIALSLSALLLSSCFPGEKNNKTDEIKVPIFSQQLSFDPISANNYESRVIIGHVYETLFHYHYLKRPLKLRPKLAAGFPVISKDGLTHTFKIKKGVYFHDNVAFKSGQGREVTANDFVYSWKRLSDPRVDGNGFWIFDGKIVGLNHWRNKIRRGEGKFADPIDGFQATDKYTLVIRLTEPYYQLHHVLANTFTAVVPREIVKDEGPITIPVGTGPYQWQKKTAEGVIKLTKNSKWHGGIYPTGGEKSDRKNGLLIDSGKPLPFLEAIHFEPTKNNKAAWEKIVSGKLHVFPYIDEEILATATTKGDLKADSNNGRVRLISNIEPDLVYTVFNLSDPLLKENRKLRQAMAHALDHEEFIRRFYKGRAIAAQGPIPPNVAGYDPKFKNPFLKFDLTKAKELLNQAGYPAGKGLKEFEYATTNSQTSVAMAKFFQSSMEQIGIKIKVAASSLPTYSQKVRDRQAHMWDVAWSASYPDAESLLRLLYGGDKLRGDESFHFDKGEFDRLYKKATRLPPGEARTRIYRKMQEIVAEKLPWIPRAHRLSHHLTSGKVKNYKPNNYMYDIYTYVRLEE